MKRPSEDPVCEAVKLRGRLWTAWESYREAQLVPAKFSPDQERELRRAFFAGAWGAVCELVAVSRQTPRLRTRLADLAEEGASFASQVGLGEPGCPL